MFLKWTRTNVSLWINWSPLDHWHWEPLLLNMITHICLSLPGLLSTSCCCSSVLLSRRSVSSLLFDPADGQQQLLWAQGRLVWTGLLQLEGAVLLLLLDHRGIEAPELVCWGCLQSINVFKVKRRNLRELKCLQNSHISVFVDKKLSTFIMNWSGDINTVGLFKPFTGQKHQLWHHWLGCHQRKFHPISSLRFKMCWTAVPLMSTRCCCSSFPWGLVEWAFKIRFTKLQKLEVFKVRLSKLTR